MGNEIQGRARSNGEKYHVCGFKKLAAVRPDSRLLSSEFNAFSFGSLPNLRQAGIPETQKTIAFWLPTLLQAK